MIAIKVNGQELYIPNGTNLQLKINNSIFDFEKIEGDIIYTFDIPAKPNDVIFQHARFVYVKREKQYEAEIILNGLTFAKGLLLLQEATPEKYSIGIAINPYPTGFAKRLLADNTYEDNELGIAPTTFATHWDKINTLLNNSLAIDSVVKFPGFYSDNFYPGYNGEDDPGACPNRLFAKIGLNAYFGWTGFVEAAHHEPIFNRFMVNESGEACEYTLIKLKEKKLQINPTLDPILDFNNYCSYYNTDSLVPAIQFSHLVKKVINVAGYRAIGEFFTNERIARIFYQSMRALDATPKSLYDDSTKNYFNYLWNIFTPSIPLEKHVPNLTNSSLLNMLCKLFGTTWYINSQTKTVEIGLIPSLMQSKAIDLSEFVLSNELSVEGGESKVYTFKLGAFDPVEITEEYWYGEVTLLSELPINSDLVGKMALVKQYNAIYKCEETGDTVPGTIAWGLKGGNSRDIHLGSSDDDSSVDALEPAAIIPTIIEGVNYDYIDNGYERYDFSYPNDLITKIDLNGISSIFNTGVKDFPLILTNYYGEIRRTINSIDYRCSACYPVITYEEIEENGISENIQLKTTGSNSLGTDFITPFIEMLENYEIITYQFAFPVAKMLEVIELLKPQSFNPKNQTRWVVIDYVKLLPMKMTFEFVKGRSLIKSEIKFAKLLNGL